MHLNGITSTMSLIPLAVIAFSTTAALVTEFLQWFFVWRTPGFVTLKNNLSKHEKLVDDAKETSTTKNLKKKEQRLQTWRTEAGRQMASYNMKASVVVSRPLPPPLPPLVSTVTVACNALAKTALLPACVCPSQLMVCVLVTYKVMTRLFSQIGPVGRLPFEPPPFLQKVTHRGLDASADARDCSAVRREGGCCCALSTQAAFSTADCMLPAHGTGPAILQPALLFFDRFSQPARSSLSSSRDLCAGVYLRAVPGIRAHGDWQAAQPGHGPGVQRHHAHPAKGLPLAVHGRQKGQVMQCLQGPGAPLSCSTPSLPAAVLHYACLAPCLLAASDFPRSSFLPCLWVYITLVKLPRWRALQKSLAAQTWIVAPAGHEHEGPGV